MLLGKRKGRLRARPKSPGDNISPKRRPQKSLHEMRERATLSFVRLFWRGRRSKYGEGGGRLLLIGEEGVGEGNGSGAKASRKRRRTGGGRGRGAKRPRREPLPCETQSSILLLLSSRIASSIRVVDPGWVGIGSLSVLYQISERGPPPRLSLTPPIRDSHQALPRSATLVHGGHLPSTNNLEKH